MTGISSLGVGSGIDVRGLVDQLVAAERAPQANRINRSQGRLETQLSALGQVRSLLSSFQQKVADLSRVGSFQTTSANSSNSSAVGISAVKGAENGSFDIQVNRLAQSQSIATGAFESRDTALGTGSLTFRFGAVETDEGGAITGFNQNGDKATRTIDIDPANNTLSGIRDAVNAADMGVRANILNDGTGERLVFSSTESGAANSFVIDTEGAGLEGLAFNETNQAAQLTRQGMDAELTVDGLAVTRASNTIDDLIEGATLTLKQTTEVPAQVNVSTDNSGARQQVEGFVEAFNTLQSELTKLTRFDPETEQAGPLNGNALVRNIVNQIRNTLTSPVSSLEGRSVRSMADIGVITRRDGGMELNAERLTQALDRDPDAVVALFSPTGIIDGKGMSFDSSRSATQNGVFGVNVTELASRGRYNGGGGIANEPVDIADGANSFRIRVDGTNSQTLTLRPGTYDSPNALARELQSLINGDSNLRDAERNVTVTFDAGEGRFVVRSERFGEESTVSFSNVPAALSAATGLGAGESVAGRDVAGTINGQAAEGFGQFLTGLSGAAEGLKVKVPGPETGNLGNVVFSGGIMGQLDRQLQNLIGSEGSLRNITSSLNGRLERLEADKERLDRRMQRVEARYIAQFSAMDQMVAQMNETSQFLTQQLGQLNNGQR